MTTASTSSPPLLPFAPGRAIQKGRVGEGATGSTDKAERWPALPLEQWKDTYATLQMWTQIVGKISSRTHSPDQPLVECAELIDPARNMKTPEQGAATSVWCATCPQLEGLGAVYCEDCDIAVPVPGDCKELRGVRPRGH